LWGEIKERIKIAQVKVNVIRRFWLLFLFHLLSIEILGFGEIKKQKQKEERRKKIFSNSKFISKLFLNHYN
jgi:hypothetical protein